jgi:hypothetical protein
MRTIHTDLAAACCTTVALAPDGLALMVFDATHTDIVDASGTTVASLAGWPGGMWADDSRHLCTLRQVDPSALESPAELITTDLAGQEHVVARVPGWGPHTQPVLGRCSFHDDQAVIFTQSFGTNVAPTVVRISTGEPIIPEWTHSSLTQYAAISGDGRYVLGRQDGGQAIVIDASSGRNVATVPGQPEAMSWNGHVVITAEIETLQLRATDWRAGVTVFESNPAQTDCPCPFPQAAVATHLNSDDLALAVSSLPGQPEQHAELWLVSDGQAARQLDADVLFGIA